MSKTSNKQKYECLMPWLEWFKKSHNYKKHNSKKSKQFSNDYVPNGKN